MIEIPVSYKEGELVLVLLPLIGKPLQAKFFGPYVIERRIGEVDYVVRTPDRRKSRRVVHVNLLRKYISRVTDTPLPLLLSLLLVRYFGMDNSPPSPWITWSWSREGNCHLS